MSSPKYITSFSGNYEFLSNFYLSKITFEGIEYPTVEHAFQAAKSSSIMDRIIISSVRSPGEAKALGRNLDLRSDWESVKDGIMHQLLKLKFSSDPLKGLLVRTVGSILIEGNTWGDRYWGCDGYGENELGQLLMQVRGDIIADMGE